MSLWDPEPPRPPGGPMSPGGGCRGWTPLLAGPDRCTGFPPRGGMPAGSIFRRSSLKDSSFFGGLSAENNPTQRSSQSPPQHKADTFLRGVTFDPGPLLGPFWTCSREEPPPLPPHLGRAPILTPVLVAGVRSSIPDGPSLLAGVTGGGGAGTGRGHRAGQVGVHVVRIGAAGGAAGGRRRGHGRHAAHAQ